MSKTRIILIGCAVVVFAAGVSSGLLISRVKGRRAGHSWLASKLGLTPPQQEEMRKIWSEMRGSSPGRRGEKRKTLAQERDQAIAAILADEQKPKYEAIFQEYARKVEELSQERQRAFEEAVERTKRILTPEQAQKYEELLKERRERGSGGSPESSAPPGRGGPPHHDGADGPATDEKRTPRGGE